jgi:hypothetical protein
MPRKKTDGLPDGLPRGARTLPSGRISIQFRCTHKGVKGRWSQNTILTDEPASYGTREEAWAGYFKVRAYLDKQVDREQTVRGFWERWLDVDDPRWGLKARPERGEHARYIYASRTRAFVEVYGDREMASLREPDIERYAESPAYALSHMKVISTFLRDAMQANLLDANPAAKFTKQAVKALNRHREENRLPVPSVAQVDAALTHMRRHMDVYPRSFYGWYLTGVRTGMRGAEIDAMQFEYVDLSEQLYSVRHQLHYRTNTLAWPKWVHRLDDIRSVWLPDDVLFEIRHQRRERMAMDGWDRDFIWLNTQFGPWRHNPREKWWHKQVGGTSLREICGGVPLYNATRHHWASTMLNVHHANLYVTSQAFGHKDGGQLMLDRYVPRALRAAALEVGRIQTAAREQQAQTEPINLEARR